MLPVIGLFKQIFNTQAVAPPPRVMVFNKDMAARGDLHGYLGIGRNIAALTQGEFTHLTAPELETLYPELPYAQRFEAYCQQHGTPDILLSRDAWADYNLKQVPLQISRNNETVRREFKVKSCLGLVPHHLTAETLQSHGAAFRQKHPQVTGELVAYLMTNPADLDATGKNLLAKAKHHGRLTFFICSYHSTPAGHPAGLAEKMQALAQEWGMADKITIEIFDYAEAVKKPPVYNPYLGLLQEADYLVLGCGSTSMLSEALFTGKTIYSDDGGIIPLHTALRRKGFIKPLHKDPDAPFKTQRIQPVDATQKIAAAIVRHYNKKKMR